MTTDVFSGYVDELAPLRAERLLDLANAANPSKPWIDRLISTIQRAAHEAAIVAGSVFTVNGKPVGVDGLKRWFGKVVGRVADDGEVKSATPNAARAQARRANGRAR
jgi:hypothetical protein